MITFLNWLVFREMIKKYRDPYLRHAMTEQFKSLCVKTLCVDFLIIFIVVTLIILNYYEQTN